MTNINNLLDEYELSQIKELHESINKSDTERDNKLLSINTTIFAIVITLTSINKDNKFLFYLYLFTLLIFVISILTGFIQTNSNSHMYRKALDKYIKHLSEIKTGMKSDSNVMVNTGPFYGFITQVFHISTYLAIVSLAVFTILKHTI